MRTTSINVFNNQQIEIFIEKHEHWFELWQVGKLKQRMVLNHYLTHDDLESYLGYAKFGDIIWRDASHEEIPTEKHQNAIEYEETIKAGRFIDSQLSPHLDTTGFLPIDRKALNTAKRLILGKWTDGNVTLSLEPNHKLQWSCLNKPNLHKLGENISGHAPDWWDFARWQLPLWNTEHRCGVRASILHVDDQELHFPTGGAGIIARIFRRC